MFWWLKESRIFTTSAAHKCPKAFVYHSGMWPLRQKERKCKQIIQAGKPWISWREFWIHFSFLISKCASKDLSYYSKVISWHLHYTYGTRSSPRNSILSADNGWDWASLVAQTVKNPPAMQETWVLSQGREDPQQDEMATHSNILAWRIPWTEAWRATVHGVTGVRHDRATHTHRLGITVQESSGVWNKNR